MIPILSFRVKLLLAMMLAVGCVSVATLLVTQQRVQANYERLFREQFDRQIGYFTTLQENRLAAIKEKCLGFSQSDRLITAFNAQKVAPKVLYELARDELREALGSMQQQVRMAGPAPRGLRTTGWGFLDAEGRSLPPPDSFVNRTALAVGLKRLEQKLALVPAVLASSEPQQVGYLNIHPVTNQTTGSVVPRVRQRQPKRSIIEKRAGDRAASAALSDTNGLGLQEVIVTRINDPANDRRLGTLVLGFPLPDLIPRLKRATNSAAQLEPIRTGIFLDEHLYASPSVIPEEIAAELAEVLGERIQATHKAQDDFGWELAGEDYRVFYEMLNEGSAFPPAYQVCLYSMAEARREQTNLRWRILGAAGAALAGALLLSLFLAHGLSVPIRELVAGTGEIQAGNLAVKVPVRSRDELGRLAAAFNDMAEGLEQKERYRTVLNMVADENVARKMVSGEITLGGEEREVSVLFCDIRNFTALTQNMPPAEVIAMLNEHMTALARVVKEHHGVLDKFVGDLLMAIFGAPFSHGQDTLDAARCAVGWLAAREQLNATSPYSLGIGIGLTTGKVVAGCMGSSDRLNYTVLGERVNLASRLCDQAAPGEILTDEVTVQQLGGSVVVEPVGALQFKGFSGPIQAYRIRAVKPSV